MYNVASGHCVDSTTTQRGAYEGSPNVTASPLPAGQDDVGRVAANLAQPTLPQFRRQPRWKRVIDIVGSTVGLVLWSPLLVLVAIIIKVGSRGPIFYRQSRYGALGQPFIIWKFRTMLTTVDQGQHTNYVRQRLQANGELNKLDRQAELIPLGGLLRRLSIDELPQLLNVLRGEMSLVGPRPDVLPLSDYEAWQVRRFEVLPGLTGLWQVSGKNKTTFVQMMELDVRYVQQRSWWLDVQILFKTPWVIVRQLTNRAD